MWGKGVGGADSSLPKLLDSTRALDVRSVSCGEKHAALVTKQGEVFCWGLENGGRLGHKVNMDAPYPKLVESLTCISVQRVACGAQCTFAIANSGEVYVWGDSNHGLDLSGDGHQSQWFPHRISGSLDGIFISRISCGEWHTAMVSSSGQLFTYGDGTFGVLGHGDVQSVSQPKEVESLKGLRVKSVACGPWHTAAVVEIVAGHVKSNSPGGKLLTWGDNDKGRLGHVGKDRKLAPTCVASLVDCDFVQVSCGTTLTAALTVTGIVFTMGSSANGQLGNPRAEDVSIARVEGLLKSEFVKEISAGSFHVAVLTTKGKVYTWGMGGNGQLGLGDNKDRSSPTPVESLEDRHVESFTLDQINALTEKLSTRRQVSNIGSTVDANSTCCPAQTKFLRPEGEKLLFGDHRQCTDVHTSIKDQTSTSSYFDATIAVTDAKICRTKESKDERVEQVDVGVYVTFITLPSGQKGLNRIRFSRFLVSYSLFGANNEPTWCLVYSRKHFSEKEAEIWWEENQRRVYSKYNIKSFVTPSTGKIDH
ncbi:hypothetical protein B296_00024801 [Ensete ventricosum]|uniref:BRX domain-containing protein n=1 Tax=Ensete ventricosum TaxID=4639 RepID=A0A426ZBW9_ENSVE|nr:hypothetical protein B296_00024801 [Ensete ventricosum]